VTDSGSEPKSMDTVTKGLFASDATEAESSLHFTNLTKTEPTPAPPASQEEPTVIPTDSGNALTLLDEAALRMEASRQIDVRSRVQPLDVGFETEDVTSPSYHNRRSSRGTSTRIAIPRDNPAKPVRFATFLVFLLLCMSVYAYLVKYFPSMMSEVILTTDPMLHELHMALGVDLQQFDRAPTQIPAPPLPPPTLPPPPPVEPPREKVRGSLAVASNPSGAEIFINDSSTGLMTPTQIEVPAEGTFTIMLRKRGYYDVKRNEVTRESLGGRFEAALKKMNIAYLDVEIFPPQEAVLYVNGKPVPLRRSTASVAIPGNTSVKVRAESPTTNTFHEVTVRVPSDRRKSLQLNPKKTFRVPSGLPGK
ncbi:MAG: PEGA domain-containing protein, partial [Bdellovibrionales bacterium]